MQFAERIVRALGLPRLLAGAILLCAVWATTVGAQTATYTNLYTLTAPAGFSSFYPQGGAGGQLAGQGEGTATGGNAPDINYHALYWSGPSGVAIDLNPTGFANSDAVATSGAQQVGDGYGTATANAYHALLWTGTAASAVDLNPTGFSSSFAQGTSGTQQVGWGRGTATGNSTHALLWAGTAASAVDLNPSGFSGSYAQGANGTQQVGYGYGTTTSNNMHALLWTGTATSAVDLNPTGFTQSYANGVSGIQQVGGGYSTATSNVALLWSGTANSYVDLNPTGFTDSFANATNGSQQVGYGTNPTTGYTDALLWDGTAASYIDLGSTLGSGYDYSIATSISGSGNTVYGYAVTNSNAYQAIEWTVSVPEPASLSLLVLAAPALLVRRWRSFHHQKQSIPANSPRPNRGACFASDFA